MNDFYNAAVLCLIQGATEYLPVSSSAHLILIPRFLGWADQGLAFDIAVHVGTLLASIVYFRQDIIHITRDWAMSIVTQKSSVNGRVGWCILIASVPLAAAGASFNHLAATSLRSMAVIAATTLAFGLLMLYADNYRRGKNTIRSITYKQVILIGLGQALAIIPGTSRSGITMTVGLLLGLSRAEAAKFAFYLAIPAILMAGGWQSLQLLQRDIQVNWLLFGYSVVITAIIAFLCIHYFLRFIERIGMLPFAIYRIVLAVVLFAAM